MSQKLKFSMNKNGRDQSNQIESSILSKSIELNRTPIAIVFDYRAKYYFCGCINVGKLGMSADAPISQEDMEFYYIICRSNSNSTILPGNVYRPE